MSSLSSAICFRYLCFFCFWILLPQTGSTQTAGEFYQEGVNLVNSGKTTEAFAALNNALRQDSRHEESLYLRAFLFLNAGKKEEALKDYNYLLRFYPDHTGALTNRALIFMEKEQYIDALTDLNKRVKISPNDWSAYYDRAYCNGLMGKHKEAVDDFTEVLKLRPDHKDALANRGFSMINMLTKDGLIRPSREEVIDACTDMQRAKELGDSSVTRMLKLYCTEQ